MRLCVDQVDEFVEVLTELMEAVVYDSKSCSCCSIPQTWDAKGKLADFLNRLEKKNESSL